MDSWSPSIRDAFEHGPVCIQPNIPNDQQSEDCLFLNIYVPGKRCLDNSAPITPLSGTKN